MVKIGVKGGDTVAKSLGGIQGALKSLKDTSLEAKAALVGTIYALEQLMTGAAKRGSDLVKFNNLTDISVETLQRYQNAGRQMGVANEDMASSFVSVQKAMGDMLTGKGAPAGFSIFAGATKLDMSRVRDTEYVLKKLNEFAKQAPPELSNSVLGGFGLSQDMQAAMRKSTLASLAANVKPSEIYKPGEVETLNKINLAWMNLKNTFDMFMGHETARFGLPIVNHLKGALDLVIRTISSIEDLIGKFPSLKDAGQAAMLAIGAAMIAFGGPLTALSVAITGIIFLLGEWDKHSKGLESIFGGAEKTESGNGNKPGMLSSAMLDAENSLSGLWDDFWNKGKKNQESQPITAMPAEITPNAPTVAGANKVNNVTVNQSLNFQHDGKNSSKVAADTHKAIQQAARQFPIQGN